MQVIRDLLSRDLSETDELVRVAESVTPYRSGRNLW
jgi:hypothetical protein